MPETTRAKMHPNPDGARLIFKDVNVVVPGANRSELLARHLLQWRNRTDFPGVLVEKRMAHVFSVLTTDSKADRLPNVIHDHCDLPSNLRGIGIGPDGFVTTRDVVANSRGRDGVSISDHAPDGNRITLVVVGHQSHSIGGLGTVLNLRQSAGLNRVSPHWNIVDESHGHLPNEEYIRNRVESVQI